MTFVKNLPMVILAGANLKKEIGMLMMLLGGINGLMIFSPYNRFSVSGGAITIFRKTLTYNETLSMGILGVFFS